MGRALLLASLLLTCTAGLTDAAGLCDFTDDKSLTDCVRGILLASRPALRKRIEPLHVRDVNGTGELDWSLSKVRVHGLGSYTLDRLRIAHSGPLLLTVQFHASWPLLSATGAGAFRWCSKALLGQRRCFSFSAKPRVRVRTSRAGISTQLVLMYRDDRLRVVPTRTEVSVQLTEIHVNVNLDGFLGVLDRMLGNPSDKYVKRLTKEWWTKNKESLEEKIKKHFDRLIEKHLSSDLATLLKGVRPHL